MVTADVYDIPAWSGLLEDNKIQLTVADPPYGKIVKNDWDQIESTKLATDLVEWCNELSTICHPGAALYMWGGYGTPYNRAFYKFVLMLEQETDWQMAAHLTWHKKRAYGTSTNYLSTREEIAYCTLGNIKKPRVFNVPLLDVKRGYAGYSAKYSAKSEYLRRTMVWRDFVDLRLCGVEAEVILEDLMTDEYRSMCWDDITEIFRGKSHPCEKPQALSKVMIETSSNPGDWVLDAFAGSRNCAKVAEQLGRNCVSVEKDK